MSQQKIEAWISRRLVQTPLPDWFTLRHVNSETGESDRAEKYPVEKGDPKSVAHAIASVIYDQAHEHASAWPGRPQLYRVVAIVRHKAEGVFPFRVRAEGRFSGDALDGGSDPPTPGGVLAQHMRFTEGAIRIALESNASTIESLRRENQELRASQERDAERRMKFLETFEDMMDRRQEREIELLKFKEQEARRNSMLNRVVQEVLPPLAKKIPALIGGSEDSDTPAKKQKTSPDSSDMSMKLLSVLSSIPDDLRDKLIGSLPDEAKKNLESIIDSFQQ